MLVAVGQLPFVNDQPGVDRLAFVFAGNDSRNDLVERHDHVLEIAARQSRSARYAVVSVPGTAIVASRS